MRVPARGGRLGRGTGLVPGRRQLVFSARDQQPGATVCLSWTWKIFRSPRWSLERPDAAGDFQPRFSPDGATLAWIGLDQTGRTGLFTAAVAGGSAQIVVMGLAALQGLAWSPDGNSLVYAAAPAGRFDLWSVAAAGGQPRWIPTPGRLRLESHHRARRPVNWYTKKSGPTRICGGSGSWAAIPGSWKPGPSSARRGGSTRRTSIPTAAGSCSSRPGRAARSCGWRTGGKQSRRA